MKHAPLDPAGLAHLVREAEKATPADDPRGWHAPGLDEGTLQVLRLEGGCGGEGMAYRVLRGRVDAGEGGRLVLGPRAVLSFDTYFNSFYESYWTAHTALARVRLRLYGRGEVVVTVRRQAVDGSTRRAAAQAVPLDAEAGGTVEVALEPHAATAGRLFFNIEAPAGAVILGGRYEADLAPVRPVRLGIGLCTFNREAQIARNLGRLLTSPYADRFAPEIVVVNQGRPFTSEATAALAAAPGVRVIEQPNLGGAGGFTRAAYEIVKAGRCTHVLFMDDDIELDPAVLVTAHAFAARTQVPTLVGGAMLDLYRPTTMYEAGAVVGHDNVLRAALHGAALDRPEALARMAREVPCHFNGWWFCAIPAEAFAEHGWPLPVFIRGDDMEYGVRLAGRGLPTVSLPPVSVWHEPFYGKPPGWQLYYDLRNRLIFAASHPDVADLDPPSVILRRLVDSLLKHNYLGAALLIRGVADFLAGPMILDRPADELHAEITALAAGHAPGKLASAMGLRAAPWRRPPGRLWRPARLLAGLGRLLAGSVRRSARPSLIYLDEWHPGMTMGVSHYALSDRLGSYVQVYAYDRDRLRRLLAEGVRVLRRYGRERAEAAARWRAAHPGLTARERWAATFSRRPA